MTNKEALIEAIHKYNWRVSHPEGSFPGQWKDCSLCDTSKLLCRGCIMFGLWPAAFGLVAECETKFSAWEIQDELEIKLNGVWGDITLYDRSFFCLILVEAFHSRLQELYRNENK